MSIAAEITRLADAKTEIKRAINAKGGTLVNERLSEYASAIDNLAATLLIDASKTKLDKEWQQNICKTKENFSVNEHVLDIIEPTR